jgi:hypothetical protein
VLCFFLALQWFTMMSVTRHQQLDLRFCDRFLLAFYTQDPVAVVQIKIDPAMGKGLLQKENDTSGNQLILHIGLEDLYNFHIDSYC